MSYIVQPLSERKSDRGCNFFNLRNLTEINGHISNLQEFPVCVNLPNSTGDLVVLLRVIAVVHHGCYIAGFQSSTTVQCVSMWSGICGMIEQSVVGAVAKFVFAAALLLHPDHSISRPRLPATAKIFHDSLILTQKTTSAKPFRDGRCGFFLGVFCNRPLRNCVLRENTFEEFLVLEVSMNIVVFTIITSK